MTEVERLDRAERRAGAEGEQGRHALVERGGEIDDDHLSGALKHGCSPDDNPAVRATMDAVRAMVGGAGRWQQEHVDAPRWGGIS